MSKCQKLEKEECIKDKDCIFTNGNKRKYCRTKKNKKTQTSPKKTTPKKTTPKKDSPKKTTPKKTTPKKMTPKKTTPKKTTPKKASPEEDTSPIVYIASMNMRGKWAVAPDGCKKINVTSSQASKSKYRLAFSPMTPIEGGYKGFYCFENYWQQGKRYEGITDIDKQLEWWKNQEKGKRRYPPGKNKKIMHAVYPGFDKPLDYITSRKLVYVPEYYKLISNNHVLKDLKEEANNKCLVVYDFDGPRKNDKSPSIEKVTLNLLKEKINDPRFPFGHGYIVAASILGYTPSDYIS